MAAITAEEVVVDLLARTDKLERQLSSAGRTVDQRLSTMEARGRQFATKFTGFLAGVSVVAIATELGKLADASKQLDAQLRLATAGFGSFDKAKKDVQRLATETRSSLEATAALYGNFARATQQVGGNQEQAARATETFSKALKIGGADANAAASATLQFGQALASGALRGDEFNSIAEASPRIVRLIADAMGVTQGKVRALAAEGKLTSDVLFRALTDRKFTAAIDQEFAQLPTTFGQSMQQVENAAIITFGAFDEGGQFSNALVNFLTKGTGTFQSLADRARDSGIEIRAQFAGLSDAFQPLLNSANSVFGLIDQKASGAGDRVLNLLQLFDKVQNADVAFDRFYAKGVNALKRGGVLMGGPVAVPEYQDSAGRYQRGRDLSDRTSQARIRRDAAVARLEAKGFIVPRNADGSVDEAGIKRAPKPAATLRTTVTKPTKGGGGARATTKSALDPEGFAREQAQLADQILSAKAREAQTAEEVSALELQRIEASRARYAAETTGNKRYTAAQSAQLVAANNLVAATEAAAIVRQRDIEIERRASAAIQRNLDTLDAQARNDQDALRSNLDLAKTAKERREIELRLLDLAHKQERAAQEQLIIMQRRVLSDPNATADARAEAQATLDRAQGRLATLDVTQPNEVKATAARNAGPLGKYRQSLDDPATQVEQAVADKLAQVDASIADAAASVLGVKDPFLRSLLQIFLQQNVFKPLYDALSGASGGGGGGIFGSILGTLGSVFGGGGGGGGTWFNPSPGQTGGFGGPRAMGGPVSAGKTYLIGEEGPELLRMGAQGGTVVPNHALNLNPNARAAMGGGQTVVHQHFTLDARGGITTPELLQHVNQVAKTEAGRAGVASYRQSMRDAPAAVGRAQRYGTTR